MTAIIAITLPWPSSELSPNGTDHLWKRTAAKKAAKSHASLLVWEWLNYHPQPKRPTWVKVTYQIYPPDNRWRDADNVVAMLKSSQDGIFEALGWNDHLIRCGEWEVFPPIKGGEIIYTINTIVEVLEREAK